MKAMTKSADGTNMDNNGSPLNYSAPGAEQAFHAMLDDLISNYQAAQR